MLAFSVISFICVAVLRSGCCQVLQLSQNNDTVTIALSREIHVVVNKRPWLITFYDSLSNTTILQEAKTEFQKTGFGKWEGKYLHIYEGYLSRVGRITEWYDVTNLLGYNVYSNDVFFYIGTTDKKSNRTLLLHLYDLHYNPRQFSFTFEVEDKNNCNRISWPLMIKDEEEGIFGFGERFTLTNFRGKRVTNWIEDGSWSVGKLFPDMQVPKGSENTHFPVPLFFSSKGYGFQLNTFYRSVFDNEFQNDIMYITAETNIMAGTIFAGRSIRESFRMTIEKNGRSLIPPPWALLFEEDIPISVVVNTLRFFPDGEGQGQHPDIVRQNDFLLSLGLPTTAYFSPVIDVRWKQPYTYAAENNFFARNQQGQPYNYTYIGQSDFFVSQIDFSSINATKWYQGQLQHAMDLGFRGWMYDLGEYTPPDSISSYGVDGLMMHNQYPLLYHQACSEHLKKTNEYEFPYAPDYLFYVRSGYLGSQDYTWAHWTGHPSSDWSPTSGLPAHLTAMLNIGISGIPYTGSDIGGFEWYTVPSPDEELWIRWTQLGTFSGYMHEQGGGIGIGHKSHIFDTVNGTRLWRKFAKLRTQLFPYIYTQAHTAFQTGLPIMRHHILSFEEDKTATAQQYQYMFGDKILVAPVYEPGVTERDVYLPQNISWYDVSTNLTYDEHDGRFRIGYSNVLQGGQLISMPSPLYTCPFLVRCGSIITLLDPSVKVLRSASHPNLTSIDKSSVYHVWVFPDENHRADGVDWQNNTFIFRKFSDQENLFTYGVKIKAKQYTWVVSQIMLKEQPHDLLDGFGGVINNVQSWEHVVQKDADRVGLWSYDQSVRVLWIGSVSTLSNVTIAVNYDFV